MNQLYQQAQIAMVKLEEFLPGSVMLAMVDVNEQEIQD